MGVKGEICFVFAEVRVASLAFLSVRWICVFPKKTRTGNMPILIVSEMKMCFLKEDKNGQ